LIEKNANIFDQTLSKHLKILDFDIFKTFSTNYFLHAFGVRGLGILPKIKSKHQLKSVSLTFADVCFLR
jgi:hypothetical protein